MGMLSLAIKKDWHAGRWTTKLNFQDMFYTFQYRGSTTVPELNTQSVYRWDNRVVNLSLSYKLGRSASLLKEKKQ
jgi:hypothetical protein